MQLEGMVKWHYTFFAEYDGECREFVRRESGAIKGKYREREQEKKKRKEK